MPLRNERRRRVLSDEAYQADSSDGQPSGRVGADGAKDGGPSAAYAPAARRDQQPRLTDLVPVRYFTFVMLLAAGLTTIVGIEILYTWRSELAGLLGAQHVSAIDVTARGCLAAWFGSLLLGVNAMVALLIYSLRRHRVDDYHGRYRIWLWTALLSLVASVDETASLHRLGRAVARISALRFGIHEAWVWGTILAAVGGFLLIRLGLEIRRCRMAAVMLLTAISCWGFSVAVHFGWVAPVLELHVPMLQVGGQLLGHLLLLLGSGLYARHVVLDAEGLITHRKPKIKKVKPAKKKPSEKETKTESPKTPAASPTRTDLDPVAKTAVAAQSFRSDAHHNRLAAGAKPQQAASFGSSDDEDDDDVSTNDYSSLSRAERKRLKRQKRLERQRAE